ncbi:MAG: hypothetical protein R3E66_03290 [bacterium]
MKWFVLAGALLWAATGYAEPCESYVKGVEVGRLNDARLNELSGLARASDGNLWAHNDSGDTARVFKVSTTGEILGTWNLLGVTATDFEDMTNAPCPQGACLIVADIGNNSTNRQELQLHRFVEPTTPQDVTVETTTFRYPADPVDAEGVFAVQDAVYIVSKEGNLTQVFRVPWNTTEIQTAEQVATMTEPLAVTGADLSEDGTKILVRGYFSIAEFTVNGRIEDAFVSPRYLPYAAEMQGEAVVYLKDQPGVVTIGEAVNAKVMRYACAAVDAPDVGQADMDVQAGDVGNANAEDSGSTPDVGTPPPTPARSSDGCGSVVPWWLLLGFWRRRMH